MVGQVLATMAAPWLIGLVIDHGLPEALDGRYRTLFRLTALLGVAALLNPGCFAGPYAGMDARMKALFLDRINEARPVWRFW